MDDRDEEPVVIYHSHTATEAYPSRTDISYASEPDAHYVLVSTARGGRGGVPLVPDRGRGGDRGRGHGRGVRTDRLVNCYVTIDPMTSPVRRAGSVAPVQSFLFAHTPADVVYDCR